MKLFLPLLCAPLFIGHLPASELQKSWAADTTRNMVKEAQHVPTQFTEENLVWEVDFGSKSQYPMPVIIDDKALIAGATAEFSDDPYWNEGFAKGGFVSCLDLQTGQELWRVIAPDPSRPGSFGVCGSPVVIGDRVYVQSALDVMCLDLNGLADGNQGMQDELSVYTQNGFRTPEGEGRPSAIPDWSGDILWHFTFRDMGIQIQDSTATTPLVFGDQVWIATANEMGTEARGAKNEETGRYNPPEQKPRLLVLDRATGELIAHDEMEVPIVFHGEWSSPSLLEINGEQCVIFGDGYGVLHGFAIPEKSESGEPVILEELWTFDLNPREYRYDEQGRRHPYTQDLRLGYKYPEDWPSDEDKWFLNLENMRSPEERFIADGPCEVIAMPVVVDNLVYLAIGRDFNYDGGLPPDHREFSGPPSKGFRRFGTGRMLCLEFEKVTEPPRVRWEDRDVGRTQSNVSVHEGFVYLADFSGFLYCWDADTGELVYQFDVGASVRERSQLVADGKIYICNDKNLFQVIEAGPTPRLISETRLKHHIATVEVADGLLLKVSHDNAELYRHLP